MRQTTGRFRVTTSRPRDHVRNLSVRAGDIVGVGHRNQQYPELFWCTPEHGYSGWMAESYLEFTSPTEAVVRADFDASQLTVLEGETVERLETVGSWVLCRNEDGVEGWVPQSILEEIADE